MSAKCWNCLKPVAKDDHVCKECGQPSVPNPMQAANARSRVEYLLREASGWSFLPPETAATLQSVYRGRLERLDSLSSGGERDWPVEEELVAPPAPIALSRPHEAVHSPTPEAVPRPTPEAVPRPSLVAVPSPSPEAAPSPPLEAVLTAQPPLAVKAASEPLAAKILAEADIRWFHSLGALMVVAAVVGWLRATWDGYGKDLAGLLILLSPAALHFVAHQMRRSVPLSARLLAILAGLLTAPALLAVEVFGFLPDGVASADYWTLAFLVSGALLGLQAHSMKERVPLYVGAICVVMAGWSQSSTVTSVLCLMLGFLLGPVKVQPAAPAEERRWSSDLQKVGFAAGSFGCFCTLFLFQPERTPMTPLVLFTAALIYLHLPTLQRGSGSSVGGPNRVFVQAVVTIIGMILMRWALDVPAGSVGLYSLMASGLFLCARPEKDEGALALSVGSGLGVAGLGIGFFSQPHLIPGEPGVDLTTIVLRFLLALLGAGLFGYLSRQPHLSKEVRPLGFASLLATFGGWYHLFLHFCTPIDESYLVENGQLAPLVASFGLWVALWLIGSRWLRAGERDLVASVTAVVLAASASAAALGALALEMQAPTWSVVLLWLFAVTLAWERGLLVPAPRPILDSAGRSSATAISALLPRLVVWSLALGVVASGRFPTDLVALPMQIFGLILLLGPALGYRQPGMEMIWLMAPVALLTGWSSGPFPQQILVMQILFAAGWAAPTASLRRSSLLLSVAVSACVAVGSLGSTSHAALLSLPLGYALALALECPRRPRGAWNGLGQARFGFDALLNLTLFLPLHLAHNSGQSYLVAASLPAIAMAFRWCSKMNLAARVISPASSVCLLVSGFLWTLGQSPQESGLLLLLASGWAFTGRESAIEGLSGWDLANGFAILGTAWLLSPSLSHEAPNVLALAAGALLSEILALVAHRWRPDVSNSLILIALLFLSNSTSGPEAGVALLAGLAAAVRGVASARIPVLASGLLLFLKSAEAQLQPLDVGLKTRLLPVALFLIGSALWLSTRRDDGVRAKLGFSPLLALRLGVGLLAIPPLLGVAANFDLWNNFVWVLTVGCATLALSFAFTRHRSLQSQLRQAAAWTLTGWAVVSLGRAALRIPWQLAILVVGLVLVAAGIYAEKRRKGKSETDLC